ncbi:hypothetical protein [Gordonia sputi]
MNTAIRRRTPSTRLQHATTGLLALGIAAAGLSMTTGTGTANAEIIGTINGRAAYSSAHFGDYSQCNAIARNAIAAGAKKYGDGFATCYRVGDHFIFASPWEA